MHKHDLHTKIALWVNRGVALLVFALLFFLPAILRWYCSIRMLTQLDQQGITVAFYCCAAVIFVALWNIERLMKNILAVASDLKFEGSPIASPAVLVSEISVAGEE